MNINVYIDGYNLFYGALKSPKVDLNAPLNIQSIQQQKIDSTRRLRWLNPEELVCRFIKHPFTINKIKFYTADIIAFYNGHKAPERQAEYYKALCTLPNIEIHKGRFYKNKASMPAYPITNPIAMVNVLKTEEKGSDVNLATHLVYDACQGNFDMAVIITNDSDLLEPIKTVQILGKKILILCPHPKFCYEFTKEFGTVRMRKIESRDLKASQFDDKLYDSHRNLITQRPAKWS